VTARGKSLYWAGLNKGKRSLAVDTRSPEGRELIAPDELIKAGKGPALRAHFHGAQLRQLPKVVPAW